MNQLGARAQRWRTAVEAAVRCDVHAAIGTVARDTDGLADSHRSARESPAIGEVTAQPLVRHDELLLTTTGGVEPALARQAALRATGEAQSQL